MGPGRQSRRRVRPGAYVPGLMSDGRPPATLAAWTPHPSPRHPRTAPAADSPSGGRADDDEGHGLGGWRPVRARARTARGERAEGFRHLPRHRIAARREPARRRGPPEPGGRAGHDLPRGHRRSGLARLLPNGPGGLLPGRVPFVPRDGSRSGSDRGHPRATCVDHCRDRHLPRSVPRDRRLLEREHTGRQRGDRPPRPPRVLHGGPVGPRAAGARDGAPIAGGGGGGDRRTPADRPGTARHGRAQHRHHRHPGRGGIPRHPDPTGRGRRSVASHRNHQQGDPVGPSAHPGCTAPDRHSCGRLGPDTPRTRPGPGRPGQAGRGHRGRGSPRRPATHRAAAPTADGHRPVGLPYRPGGVDQRGPPCGHRAVQGEHRSRGRGAVGGGRRRRAGRHRDRPGPRFRHRRHAGTSRPPARRLSVGPRPEGGFRVAARLPLPEPVGVAVAAR